MKKLIVLLSVVAVSFSTISCDDYLDIEPDGKVIPKSVEDYRQVLTMAYSKYPQHKSLTAIRTDELILDEYSSDFISYREIAMWKDVNPDQATTQFQWEAFYSVIFYANQIINEGVNTMADSAEKDQILAEAYALRAYAYFDLINLYGKPYNATTAATDRGVPLVLALNLEAAVAPSSVQQIYDQIHVDIEKSSALMVEVRQTLGINYRFSKQALEAFKARIYLYQQNWEEALASANQALNISDELVDLNAASSLPNHYTSVEGIMALDNNFNSALKYMATASPELIESYDQATDLRFNVYFESSWDGYKILKGGSSDYRMSFRVSELYLIKAEALLKLNQLTEAKAILKPFLAKRYTGEGFETIQASIETMNDSALMDFILEERNREFALEGHRWFDLRRANQKQIIHMISGNEYILQPNDVRYTIEIPQQAKLNNPSL